MFRGRIAALLALLAALLLVAPGAAAAKQKPKPAFPVTIKAANGNVTITKRPARIVSLSPSTTEDLYAVGAGRQVVAVDELSNYPTRAPRTKLSGYTPNVEAIAGYRPDLVIVRSEAGVAQLRRLGITVLQLKEAGDLAQAYAQVLQVGRATGHTRQATAVVRWMRKQITAELRSIQGRPRQLSVYHELTTDYYSARSATFIGRVYRLLGLRNIADEATAAGPYPQLSAEFIVAANPDLIVLADSKCCGQSLATVAARPGWGTIDAVRNRHVVAMDDDIASRWGPRIVAFVRAVAAQVRRIS
jgi:iron complex transport system substrate-binding protein